MALKLELPITYLITSGQTSATTTPDSPEFLKILNLVEAATVAGVSLIQIREKNLPVRVLADLSSRASIITRKSETRVLINDRVDVALAHGADGVHLTSHSLSVNVARRLSGDDFIIGISTHSVEETVIARDEGADFAVFGPVFETPSKLHLGEPQGLEKLRDASSSASMLRVLAIGGVSLNNAEECFTAGAVGVAAIRLFENPATLSHRVKVIKDCYKAVCSA
ncbi:MAG TPA: thiamine phosphate synthase [Pyrinomonadaceae bacterium]|nr:thiamine phosphate synthase [Pyrinomonadaceae bacterium]